MQVEKNFTEGKILGPLMKFALPVMFAMFLQAMYGAVDLFVVGKFATPEDVKYLADNVELQEFLLKQNNIDTFMELDNAFHQKMYSITNKMQCYYMVKSMNIHHERFRELRVHGGDRSPIIAQHKQILQAFKDHDPEQAYEITYAHINRTKLDAKEIQKKYPEYFV